MSVFIVFCFQFLRTFTLLHRIQEPERWYKPDRDEKTTKRLIDNVKVFAVIGEVSTPTSKLAILIAEAAGITFIGPFTEAEFLRDPHKRLYVNVRGSYYQQKAR